MGVAKNQIGCPNRLFKGSQEMFKARLPNREGAEELLSIEVNLGVVWGSRAPDSGMEGRGSSSGFLEILLQAYPIMYRDMR